MSKREKTLAFFVGGVVFVLINVVVIGFFTKQRAGLAQTTADTQRKIDQLKKQDEKRTWSAERDAWLTQTQPVMGDAQTAQRSLREQILEVAKKNVVDLENPQPGNPSKFPNYQSLPVAVVAKGSWKSLFYFIEELQRPEKFIVLDPLEMSVDPTDKTVIRAKITVSRWFKPAGAP